MLKPGTGAFEGFRKVGELQISGTDTTGTVALGANFADGTAVATLNALSGSSSTNYVQLAAVDASTGTLTITVDTAPGTGQTADVSYVVYGKSVVST